METYIRQNNKNYYQPSYADKIINQYIQKGGEVIQLQEGSLGVGDWICYGKGLKTCIIKEVYWNAWQSMQTVKFYRKTPKKYEKMIEDFWDNLPYE